MSSTFYYFGFGSNMLAKRIHIQNPTAVRVGPGKLEDYRLDFHTNSSGWRGSPATIVPTESSHVYGAIWEIELCNMKDLDNQEGVHQNIYMPINVPVISLDTGKILECRAYHLRNQPEGDLKGIPISAVPPNRQPSKTYLKTIVKGAIETNIPDDYINWLRSIKHNDTLVEKFEHRLELQEFKL